MKEPKNFTLTLYKKIDGKIIPHQSYVLNYNDPKDVAFANETEKTWIGFSVFNRSRREWMGKKKYDH